MHLGVPCPLTPRLALATLSVAAVAVSAATVAQPGLFAAAKRSLTKFLKSALDPGSNLYSELPKSHPFDETRKAKIMSTIKTWGVSSQEIVGQVISQLGSLTKPLSRHPVIAESQTSKLHASVWMAWPYQESPPCGAAQGIHAGPPHEKTKAAHHSSTFPAQP
ncbi:hypothetical protein VP01_3017g7 [Puccinia sorghi]|uniref:Uncharacterized protein n=1 Tax=Puccinia sorghi TaxID=27349 RepID=A0A0L6V0Y9_9BASI|nr:hypothetical protein VP01_3017g7 [Puccinia sorghi]